jgi:hypothetical protein
MEALASALVSQSQAQLLARTFQQHRVSQEQRDGFLMRFKMSWLTWVLSHGEHSSDVLASRRGKPFGSAERLSSEPYWVSLED